jgi:hypothetical protein
MSPCAMAAQQQQQQQQGQAPPPKDESMGAAMGPMPPKGAHCKLQWIWTVSPLQQVRVCGG